MRTLIYSIVFVAVIDGAAFVITNTSNKLDRPYEAGMLHAPAIEHGHGASHEAGHEAGHGEEAAHEASHS
jgi:hypothetical protein